MQEVKKVETVAMNQGGHDFHLAKCPHCHRWLTSYEHKVVPCVCGNQVELVAPAAKK